MDLDANNVLASGKRQPSVAPPTNGTAAGNAEEQLDYQQGGGFATPLWQKCHHPCSMLLVFYVEGTSDEYEACPV
jgi:hypothetical protein